MQYYDHLVSRNDVFPLGRPGGAVRLCSDLPSGSQTRPFGLHYAIAPGSSDVTEMPVIEFDPVRQIALVDGVPLCRHTDGKTRSVTKPDGQGSANDSDTDHRED